MKNFIVNKDKFTAAVIELPDGVHVQFFIPNGYEDADYYSHLIDHIKKLSETEGYEKNISGLDSESTP